MNIELKFYNVDRELIKQLNKDLGEVSEIEVYDQDDVFDNVVYIKVPANVHWNMYNCTKFPGEMVLIINSKMTSIKINQFESLTLF